MKFFFSEVPLLSTYKLETKTREGASSEPESGYKTDNSTTYTQVEEKVAEIQLKVSFIFFYFDSLKGYGYTLGKAALSYALASHVSTYLSVWVYS